MNQIDEVKNHIANGQTELAIKKMLCHVSKYNSDLKNDVILISGQFNQWKRNNLLGLDEKQNIRNKIDFAVLDISDKLEKENSQIERNRTAVVLTIEGDYDKEHEEEVDRIVKNLMNYLNDFAIRKNKTDRGSIKIQLDILEQDYETIHKLFIEGKLDGLLDAKVLNFEKAYNLSGKSVPVDKRKLKELNSILIKKDNSSITSETILEEIEEFDFNSLTHPLIVLIGLSESGKTTSLLRLVNYLDAKKIKIQHNQTFREDVDYSKMIENFFRLKKGYKLPEVTNIETTSLIDIYEKNKPIGHILDLPGDYFSTEKDYPKFLKDLIDNNTLPKIYVIYLSQDVLKSNSEKTKRYYKRIENIFREKISQNDNVVFLFNKIETIPELFVGGRIDSQALQNYMSDHLPISNLIMQSKLKNIYFVPFTSGMFSKTEDGLNRIIWSSDEYPEKLWDALRICLKPNRWF